MKIKVSLLAFLAAFSTNAFAEYAYTPVITYNMANYNDHGDWPARVEAMADEIQKNHAHIIVLQEVRYDPNEPSTKATHQNMAEQLLTALRKRNYLQDATITTQPVMYYGEIWEGLSIISRYPIRDTGTRFLTKAENCKDNNLRAIQYARLDVNGHEYVIANTHFGLTEACVASNIKETIEYLNTISSNDGIMLLGDFNTTPDNASLSLLAKAGLNDVWATFHAGNPGYTFPANQPSKRIDYIFANKIILNRIYGDEYVRQIGNTAVDGIYPSDHLGLVAEFLAY